MAQGAGRHALDMLTRIRTFWQTVQYMALVFLARKDLTFMPKTLPILTASLIILAFVFRAVIPNNLFAPGGWPLGSHWYRMSWAAFWLFLIAGIVMGVIVVINLQCAVVLPSSNTFTGSLRNQAPHFSV